MSKNHFATYSWRIRCISRRYFSWIWKISTGARWPRRICDIWEDRFEVFGAGIDPNQRSPAAAWAMKEVGIDISDHYCKTVEDYLTFHFKFMIALDESAVDKGPVFHSAEQFQ
jgi:protein-tyrosine-phosphatase